MLASVVVGYGRRGTGHASPRDTKLEGKFLMGLGAEETETHTRPGILQYTGSVPQNTVRGCACLTATPGQAERAPRTAYCYRHIIEKYAVQYARVQGKER